MTMVAMATLLVAKAASFIAGVYTISGGPSPALTVVSEASAATLGGARQASLAPLPLESRTPTTVLSLLASSGASFPVTREAARGQPGPLPAQAPIATAHLTQTLVGAPTSSARDNAASSSQSVTPSAPAPASWQAGRLLGLGMPDRMGSSLASSLAPDPADRVPGLSAGRPPTIRVGMTNSTANSPPVWAALQPAATSSAPSRASSVPPSQPTIPVQIEEGATPAAGAPLLDPARLRRSQLEERERELTQRETASAATEKRLSDRVAELSGIETRLQALQASLQERDQANWAGLVKLYESMRPNEAAAIFNALEKPILLNLLDRMRPAKAGLVLAAMDPEKAREVTADLAAKRTQSTLLVN